MMMCTSPGPLLPLFYLDVNLTPNRKSLSKHMDNFVKTQLRPMDVCIVCTEPFSAKHQPVALDCKHIFGHKCIQKWILGGRGNNTSCPICRHVLVIQVDPQHAFDVPSIWKRLCEMSLDCLHTFMEKVWTGIRNLWKRNPDGEFRVNQLLENVIFPALIGPSAQDWNGSNDALTDAYNIIAASWDSLGRPNKAEGLATPLVRLARLVSSTATTLPLYLTTLPRMTRLIWNANACIELSEENVSWDMILNASTMASDCHFPLLHLYTVLISQCIAQKSGPQQPLPTRRYEIMNFVVEKCCTKIGKSNYTGKPSDRFKDNLVSVFQELWRFQHEQARLSLRGHLKEEPIVRGMWSITSWPIKRDNYQDSV